MRKIFLSGIACALFALPGNAHASGPWDFLLAPESACPGQTDASLPSSRQVQIMSCMHNWARAQEGSAGVRVSRQLRASAARKARDIKRCQQFSHSACGRSTFYWPLHFGFFKGSAGLGEDLALASGGPPTVRDIESIWLNSDEHRAVMLNPDYDLSGTGRVTGDFHGYASTAIWVAYFGYHHR